MHADEYIEHDATSLAQLVRKGEVTPAELLELAIARIEADNPRVNAVVRRMTEEARAAVARGLPEGPLRGVPFLLKDLGADVAGVPSTMGSRFFAEHRPTVDAEIVRRHRAAGLVIVGKTNTPEVGLMGVTEPELHGPTRNPYDADRTPGGSSGGSAAAVAARMVPVAHGGDGGGSIRIPASACGLVGLKPSRGRTPYGPDPSGRWSGFVVHHGLTRTVRDTALLLDVTAGPEAGSPWHAPAPERPFVEEAAREPGRLRIAFTLEPLLRGTLHPEHRAAVERTAERLAALGHDVEPAHPELDREGLADAYMSTVAASVYGDFTYAERILGRRVRPRDVELTTWVMREIGRTLGAGRLMELHNLCNATTTALARFHERWDLLLTATTAGMPARIGELVPTPLERVGLQLLRRLPLRSLLRQALVAAQKQLEAYPSTQVFNITGQPAISLPVHRTPEGLPVGVQLSARFGDEATLLRVAAQLEAELRWSELRPRFLER